MDDLEAIRQKRLAEIQQQQQQQSSSQGSEAQAAYQQEQAQAERDAQVQAVLRQVMTPEARERLTRLRLSRKELAEQLESQLVMLAQNGRLQTKIDDEKLKVLLTQMQPQKRQTSITRM